MREIYERYSPTKATRALLHVIIGIIDSYAEQNLRLTLRQLYYQLVARDLIPNTENSYKRIGEIVSRARRGGWIRWDAVEDRVRRPQQPPQYDDLNQLLDAALYSYRLPRLVGQDAYVELWVEKDALAGVLAPIAREYHITLMVNRGYSSTSAMKEAGTRVRESCDAIGADSAVILYLGDHDPSGEDMVRDIDERLYEYVNNGWLIDDDFEQETAEERKLRLPGLKVRVEKLALTMSQIEQYDPPPNPAKLTDSRAAKYVEQHGDSSWEVDALPPQVLRSLIEDRLDELIDDTLVQKVIRKEEKDKKLLIKAVESIRGKKPKRKR
jgi:hypothetical protein